MSEAQKGRIVSEETKNKIREKRKKQIMLPFSEDSLKKMSEAKKGKPWSEARKLAQLNKNK